MTLDDNLSIDGCEEDTSGAQRQIKAHITSQEAQYWAEFYSRNDFSEGSPFFESINSLPELPRTIVDIGCGQGRDSFAFACSGKRVIGLDRSDVGVYHAREKAVVESLDSNLIFDVCDVSNELDLYDKLAKARELSDGENICYYMRFFLHSIPEDVQDKLMKTISYSAEPGDVFAAEFRTDKDEEQDKTFGNSHYRRYQNADDFSKKLSTDYGWEPVSETEEQGLSPYKDEDPVLYRVVAVRPEG